ncbi:hypothetical protein DBP15_02060 [Streptomyces sp. CS065A]|nr:hypothetical protein DBP15_02060 [Streptomyces sp. CS065A]
MPDHHSQTGLFTPPRCTRSRMQPSLANSGRSMVRAEAVLLRERASETGCRWRSSKAQASSGAVSVPKPLPQKAGLGRS